MVEANRIKADIGGSLKVESLQDTSTFTSSQKSANASISVPITGGNFGGSVGASKSNVDSSFASVGQKSGLKAGDGGFQVDVAKNTALVGAVIASNQAALDNARNSFSTGGSLSITDIQNTASFKGTASGATVGVGSELSKSGAGVGGMSGNASSTSSAGISGIAGNTSVRSGDAETGLKPIFDADKVQKDINAQVQIMTAFNSNASRTIGNYAAGQMDQAARLRIRAGSLDAADPERALLTNEANAIEANWGDNGKLRLLAHTVVGGLTGGVSGAAGVAAGTLAAPVVADALASAGVTGQLASSLTALASTAAGALVGGASGAAGAFNEVQNNYLTPRENLARNKAASACSSSGYSDAKSCGEANRLNNLDKRRDAEIAAAVKACTSSGDLQVCNSKDQMIKNLEVRGTTELRELMAELAPSCAPPKDCAQAANWRSNELSTLTGASRQLWPYVASGGVQSTAGPVEMAVGGWATVGTRVVAGQTALLPEAAISAGQWGWGALKGAATGAVLYTGMNIADLENITPANLVIAAVSGGVGSGLVRRGLNYGATLPNTFIPLTVPNAVTQVTGQAFGFGAASWLN